MYRTIKKLKESPCYKCGYIDECDEKIRKIYKLKEIKDYVFGKANFDYHNCSIWVSLKLDKRLMP